MTTLAHDLGNNESLSTGYSFHGEQGYLALTRVESKWFKTEAGAVRWLARRISHFFIVFVTTTGK